MSVVSGVVAGTVVVVVVVVVATVVVVVVGVAALLQPVASSASPTERTSTERVREEPGTARNATHDGVGRIVHGEARD